MAPNNKVTPEDKDSFINYKMGIVKRNAAMMCSSAAIFFFVGYRYFPFELPPMNSFADRLEFALKCQVFSVLPIITAMRGVMAIRETSTACDPIGGKAEHLLQIPHNVLRNTVEQYIFHLVGQVMLCSHLTSDSTKAIPLLVIIFVVARILFSFGYYSGEPMNRSLGFSITFMPNLLVIGYCLASSIWSFVCFVRSV